MNKVVFHAFCLCCVFVTGVIGAIIQRPLNAATSTGGQTFFNCSSNSSTITWQHTYDCLWHPGQTLTSGNCDILSNYSSHYKTEKPAGFACNLIVFDALLSLAGCYVCTDGESVVAGGQYLTMLVIVDSYAHVTPNTTDLRSGEDVMISGNISYRGPEVPKLFPPLTPAFYWTLQTDPSQNITSHVVEGYYTSRSVTTYVIVTAQPPNVPQYEINLFFNPPFQTPSGCPSNAPTYRTSWVTPPYPVNSSPDLDPYAPTNCDPMCMVMLVIAIYFGLNLVSFFVFILCYTLSESSRHKMNERFPWLKKMLPCMSDEGCQCSVWISCFVMLSTFAAIVFFPTILITTSCGKKSGKNSQGSKSDNIDIRPEVTHDDEHAIKSINLPETTSYESLQRPTKQSTTSVYEELPHGQQASSHRKDSDLNTFPEASSYESLQRATKQTKAVYEQLASGRQKISPHSKDTNSNLFLVD